MINLCVSGVFVFSFSSLSLYSLLLCFSQPSGSICCISLSRLLLLLLLSCSVYLSTFTVTALCSLSQDRAVLSVRSVSETCSSHAFAHPCFVPLIYLPSTILKSSLTKCTSTPVVFNAVSPFFYPPTPLMWVAISLFFSSQKRALKCCHAS